MAYQIPTFNLAANIWRFGNAVSNPPDVVTLANLALGRRQSMSVGKRSTSTPQSGGMWLLVPAGTDIRDFKDPVGNDTVEVAAGSGRLYDVVWVDDIGAGFANEHRFAEIIGRGPWPVPFPTPTGVTPPPPVGVLATVNQISANVTSSAFSPSPSSGVLIIVSTVGPDPGPPFVDTLPFGPLTPLIVSVRPGFAGQWHNCCAYVVGPGWTGPTSLQIIPGFTGPALIQAIVYEPSPNNMGVMSFGSTITTGSPWTKVVGATAGPGFYLFAWDCVGGATSSISYGPLPGFAPLLPDLVLNDLMGNPTRTGLWDIYPNPNTGPYTFQGSSAGPGTLYISGGILQTT